MFHALVGHVDACYGIERESTANGELIVFGGVARNAAATCLLLDEDEESLTFSVANGLDAVKTLLTWAELQIFDTAQKLVYKKARLRELPYVKVGGSVANVTPNSRRVTSRERVARHVRCGE